MAMAPHHPPIFARFDCAGIRKEMEEEEAMNSVHSLICCGCHRSRREAKLSSEMGTGIH